MGGGMDPLRPVPEGSIVDDVYDDDHPEYGPTPAFAAQDAARLDEAAINPKPAKPEELPSKPEEFASKPEEFAGSDSTVEDDRGTGPYEDRTVAQLQAVLRSRDLPVSGTKDELIDRLRG